MTRDCHDADMDASRNEHTMRRIFDALAIGDRKPFAAAMTDDFSWTIAGVASPWCRTWRGRLAVREGLFAPLFKQFAGTYTNRAVSFTSAGDRVVVECRGSVETHRGGHYDNEYCYVCRFDDAGGLVSVTEYADTALMDRELAPPAAA